MCAKGFVPWKEPAAWVAWFLATSAASSANDGTRFDDTLLTCADRGLQQNDMPACSVVLSSTIVSTHFLRYVCAVF